MTPGSHSATRDQVIAAVGRFHYDSLAIGLHRLGRLRRFCSGMPRSRMGCAEIPGEFLDSFPWLQALYMGLSRYPTLVPATWRRSLARLAQQSLDRHIARTLPDCAVYTAMSGCGLVSGAEAQRRGIRYVCERGANHIRYNDDLMRAEHAAWSLPYRDADPRMIELEEAEYAQADRLVVIKRANARSMSEYGVDPAKIRVVRQSLMPAGEPGPVDRGSGFRILFVGALSLIKGLGYLTRAFRKAAIPDSQLILVGSPLPETDRLLREGVPERTELLGGLSKQPVLQEMRRAHVMVLPSLSEGAPLVILEALACGCPVIASDIYDDDWMVDAGRNGLTVPPRDADALADALLTLHEDRELLQRMSECAPQSAGHRDGPEDYARRWLAAATD